MRVVVGLIVLLLTAAGVVGGSGVLILLGDAWLRIYVACVCLALAGVLIRGLKNG